MPDYDISTIPESGMMISGGNQLSGVTQGDGSHLVTDPPTTITLSAGAWQTVTITDNDAFFDDNDGNQNLTNAITYDSTAYSSGVKVEAEYELTLVDPDGNTYTAMGFNLVGSGGQPFGSVEGLVFLSDFPPVDVPLEVVAAAEGPSNTDTPFADYYAPPCFVTGTRIATPSGPRLVETLTAGDLVDTYDGDPKPLIWVGCATISFDRLRADPHLCPIRLPGGLTVSPQHRVLVSGWRAELVFGKTEVLVAAKHLAEAGFAETVDAASLGPDCLTYWHLMFQSHEIVVSNDVPTESFRPGPEALKAMPKAEEEFRKLFPNFSTEAPSFYPARYMAKAFEVHAMALL